MIFLLFMLICLLANLIQDKDGYAALGIAAAFELLFELAIFATWLTK